MWPNPQDTCSIANLISVLLQGLASPSLAYEHQFLFIYLAHLSVLLFKAGGWFSLLLFPVFLFFSFKHDLSFTQRVQFTTTPSSSLASSHLADLSTWISDKHLKLNMTDFCCSSPLPLLFYSKHFAVL
jgi:hypothetical protein